MGLWPEFREISGSRNSVSLWLAHTQQPDLPHHSSPGLLQATIGWEPPHVTFSLLGRGDMLFTLWLWDLRPWFSGLENRVKAANWVVYIHIRALDQKWDG